jgi:hypothetical protein
MMIFFVYDLSYNKSWIYAKFRLEYRLKLTIITFYATEISIEYTNTISKRNISRSLSKRVFNIVSSYFAKVSIVSTLFKVDLVIVLKKARKNTMEMALLRPFLLTKNICFVGEIHIFVHP